MINFRFLPILFILTFCSYIIQAQELDLEFSKGRNLHFSTGFFTSINYDQTIAASKKSDHRLNLGIQLGTLTGIRLGIIDRNTTYHQANIYASGLLGEGESFFEIGLGYEVLLELGNASHFVFHTPRVILGYRRILEQSLFRVGLGFPELVYIGTGIRF